MKHRVRVWDIKITTVEQLEKECNGKICKGCDVPCCKGLLIPLLNYDEFLSGKYPIRVVDIPELKKDVPNSQNVIGLAMRKEGCFFLKDNKCSIYKNRPKACRIYDCRVDERPGIKNFVEKRFDQCLKK